MMTVAERFVDVPGGRVFVKTWSPEGTVSAVPVLLLHDSLGCVEMWRDFPAQLAAALGRVVMAYDRLGFGRSSERGELPSVRFVSEEAKVILPALLRELSLERAVLFGHSVGGAMAVAAAGALPEVCEAVVTEAAQAFVEERTREGIRRAQTDFADPSVFARLEKYHGGKAAWVLRAWTEVWLSPEFSSWSLKEDLPAVRCPVLAIHGERDEYGSVRFPEMIRDLAGGPAEMWIIPDCGHVPHRERAREVLERVEDYFPRSLACCR